MRLVLLSLLVAACGSVTAPAGCPAPLEAFACAAADTTGALTIDVRGCVSAEELPVVQTICLRGPR